MWLSSRAGYKPVIEYCGGTEIGGGYISSTMVQPNVPSCFTGYCFGSGAMLMDDNGQAVTTGEVALMPPALGLSTFLLKRDHHKVYYEGMPAGPGGALLRRHGDEIEQVGGTSCYRALGRCDDTMNLGGIKISSIELERVCNTVPDVSETAALAINPVGGGPSLLVVVVVAANEAALLAKHGDAAKACAALKAAMQVAIKNQLNPLFGISEVVLTASLPRTASQKIMRRVCRDNYYAAKK